MDIYRCVNIHPDGEVSGRQLECRLFRPRLVFH